MFCPENTDPSWKPFSYRPIDDKEKDLKKKHNLKVRIKLKDRVIRTTVALAESLEVVRDKLLDFQSWFVSRLRLSSCLPTLIVVPVC